MRFNSVFNKRTQSSNDTLIGYLTDDKKVSVRVGSKNDSKRLEIYINDCHDKACLFKVSSWLQANFPWFSECGVDAWVVRGVSDIDSQSLKQAIKLLKACDLLEALGLCRSASEVLCGAATVSQAKFCFVGARNGAQRHSSILALSQLESIERSLHKLLFDCALEGAQLNFLLDGLCLQSSFDALAISPDIAMLALTQESLSIERYTGHSLARVYFASADTARLVFKRLAKMLDFMALPAQYHVGGRLFNKPRQTGVQYLAALDHDNAHDSERFQALLGGMIRSANQIENPDQAADILMRSMRAGKNRVKTVPGVCVRRAVVPLKACWVILSDCIHCVQLRQPLFAIHPKI